MGDTVEENGLEYEEDDEFSFQYIEFNVPVKRATGEKAQEEVVPLRNDIIALLMPGGPNQRVLIKGAAVALPLSPPVLLPVSPPPSRVAGLALIPLPARISTLPDALCSEPIVSPRPGLQTPRPDCGGKIGDPYAPLQPVPRAGAPPPPALLPKASAPESARLRPAARTRTRTRPASRGAPAPRSGDRQFASPARSRSSCPRLGRSRFLGFSDPGRGEAGVPAAALAQSAASR
ncbi:classical arabinogalactan protein 9-like [Lutra lutra]|uniref:classical arabinogalactan protein 9-like n=1 Tax=Lutra lutra TaxID=9657 RepID=UPI001FD0FF9D|nr:classical arabinogalactan protein 9-like [Lutra lutra]